MNGQRQDLVERAIHAITGPDRFAHVLEPTRAVTLHDGLAGTALVLAVLADTDPALARIVTRYWDVTAGMAKGSSPDGIYRGPGALATSLILGNAYLPASQRRDADVDRAAAWLSARACGLAHYQNDRVRRGLHGTPWAVYDAMQGLAGIGRILLAAAHSGHHAVVDPGLQAAMVTLTRMINMPYATYPGWRLPRREHHRSAGAATTGMAHGIAGPLAFLAIAVLHGHAVPGQTDAVIAAATWLLKWRTAEGTWPAHVHGSDGEQPPAHTPAVSSRRDAWCYGNAGIGNALIHAGMATRERSFTRSGHAALDAIARRPAQEWDTNGAGICHGTAGVLLTAHAHGHTGLVREASDATAAGLAAIEMNGTADRGLLTGYAGAALALCNPDHPHDGAAWTALLLLV